MARAESGLLGPLQGWLTDRYGPRNIMLIGNGLFGAGFILFSRVDSVLAFYSTFALMALGSSLGSFIPMSATIANWFARRRGTALSISMMGMGIGGLFVPTIVWSLSVYGWRTTSLFSGLAVWLVALPASLVMRHRPEAYGEVPDGAEASEAPREIARKRRQVDFNAAQALRTPAFWLLSTAHGSALFVVSAVMLHQIPHMVEGLGMSEEEAAGNVALLLVVFVSSQFVGGYLGDRVNKLVVVFLCMWLHAAAIVIFAYAESSTGAVVFAIMHGVAWGVRAPLIDSLRADYFGRSAFATISGFAVLVTMMGMTGGPLFAGILHDYYGNYRYSFLILGAFTALGSFALLMTRDPAHPSQKRPAEN